MKIRTQRLFVALNECVYSWRLLQVSHWGRWRRSWWWSRTRPSPSLWSHMEASSPLEGRNKKNKLYRETIQSGSQVKATTYLPIYKYDVFPFVFPAQTHLSVGYHSSHAAWTGSSSRTQTYPGRTMWCHYRNRKSSTPLKGEISSIYSSLLNHPLTFLQDVKRRDLGCNLFMSECLRVSWDRFINMCRGCILTQISVCCLCFTWWTWFESHLVPVGLHVHRPLVRVSVLLPLLPEVAGDVPEHDGFHDRHSLWNTNSSTVTRCGLIQVNLKVVTRGIHISVPITFTLPPESGPNSLIFLNIVQRRDLNPGDHSRELFWTNSVTPLLIVLPFKHQNPQSRFEDNPTSAGSQESNAISCPIGMWHSKVPVNDTEQL